MPATTLRPSVNASGAASSSAPPATAVPITPNTATPSAMPNSMAVSAMAAAEPAFCGGAVPITMSVPSAITGLMPR